MTYRAPGRRGVTPQDRGRFPGFDVLDQVHTWDDVTAGVVLARLAPTTDLSFFTAAEDAVARPLFDLLLEQDDDMPPDPQAWRDTLAALDADAHDEFDRPFHACSASEQGALVRRVFEAGQHGSAWHDWAGKHVWSLWTRYVCAAFWSHPWAWNEMGFGGPAYPRGYKNVGIDSRERWERRDDTGLDADGDPVPFAHRVEQAHARHAATTGAGSGNAGDAPQGPTS